MLKAAIEKIQSMTTPQVIQCNDKRVIISNDGSYNEIVMDLEEVQFINLTSLDAVVQFVKTEAVHMTDSILYLTVPTHERVHCFTSPDSAKRNHRTFFYAADATDVPGWEANMKMGFEEAQIALRTRFQETSDSLYAQKLLSDICTGSQVTFNDNGIATTVTTTRGVALQSKEAIRPIVKLRPYRTFQEIDQPVSEFLIRLSDRAISFIEADGGMWKLTARKSIKAYLEKHLSDLIERERVVVTL